MKALLKILFSAIGLLLFVAPAQSNFISPIPYVEAGNTSFSDFVIKARFPRGNFISSSFNGGRSQTGISYPQAGNEFPFINFMKSAQAWTCGSDVPNPDELNADGYPLTSASGTCWTGGNTGIITSTWTPTQAERPGNYILKWTGNGTQTLSSINGTVTVRPTVTFTGSVTSGVLTAGTPSGGSIEKGMTLSTGGIVQNQLTGSVGQAGTYTLLNGVNAGSQSMNVSGGSLTSSGGSGRYVVSTTGYQFFVGIATVGSPIITDVRLVHADDEALLDAGNVFGVKLKEKLIEANFGVIRYLDLQFANYSNVTTWATRKPISYWTYQGDEFRSSLWAGRTTHSGDAYSSSVTPTSWAGLVDKATVIVKWDASATSDATTLNIALTGAKSVRNQWGSVTSTNNNERAVAEKISTLVYDAVLDCWLKFGGDTAYQSSGLINGTPVELLLQLATEVRAHPYWLTPFLSIDPATDYMPSLMKYNIDNGQSWMVPRFEGPNELWNSIFFATGYANNKAFAYWGISFGYHEWYGKVLSILGQMGNAVFSGNHSRYQIMLGVQTASGASGGTSGSDARQNAGQFIASGPAQPSLTGSWGTINFTQSSAEDWQPYTTTAQYISPSMMYKIAELQNAYDYVVTNAGNPSAQQIIADTYTDTLTGASEIYNLNYVNDLYVAWCNWATSFGNLGCSGYEGGYSPDYNGSNWTSTITGVTVANPSVITLPVTANARYSGQSGLSGNPAKAGMSLTVPLTITGISQAASAVITVSGYNLASTGKTVAISSVNGMSQINGMTGTITGVSGQNITVNINSSAFSAYSGPSGNATLTVGVASVSGNNVTTDINGSSLPAFKSSTVTFTIASPGVVNWTSHGLSAGDMIFCTSTGNLPTLNGGWTWTAQAFAVHTVINPNSFNIAPSIFDSKFNFSGTPTGTATCSIAPLTATYVNSALYANTLRFAGKYGTNLGTYTTTNLNNFATAGGAFPANLVVAGPSTGLIRTDPIGTGGVWGIYDPSIYTATPSPQWGAIVTFNH